MECSQDVILNLIFSDKELEFICTIIKKYNITQDVISSYIKNFSLDKEIVLGNFMIDIIDIAYYTTCIEDMIFYDYVGDYLVYKNGEFIDYTGGHADDDFIKNAISIFKEICKK